ncbi:MAG: hypothetical protein IRZ32_03270 [Solirubrobacteraceae bacterium]|nr:hypothetical protein [Solirubrobacteraceae bacterium]
MATESTPSAGAADATETTKAVEADTRATERTTAATKRSTAAKKGATTRARTRTTAATKRTTAAARRTTARSAAGAKATAATAETAAAAGAQGTLERVGDVAERAVLTSVGAALTARETVEKTIEKLRAAYGSRSEAEQRLRRAQRALEADLRRYERRGTRARMTLERDVRQARARLEREIRRARERVARLVSAPPAPDALARNARARADLAAVRVGHAVESAQQAGASVVAKVTERVAQLA